MSHHPRADETRRRVHDAPDDSVRVDGARDRSAGVDRLEVDALELAAMTLEVPPGDPVLRADHGRLRAEVRGHPLGHGRQAVRFERDKDRVDVTHRREVISRFDRHRPFDAGLDDAKTGLPHRLQVRSARDEDDIDFGPRESRSEKSTDGARTENRNSHGANCSATKRRWTFPVGVRGIDSTMWRRFGTLKSARRSRE
jgi:hypothetical protein